jgi:hypothetical protein
MKIKIKPLPLLLLLCLSQSGCALVKLPFDIAGAAFGLVKNITLSALNLAQQLPMPPPWVFF